MSPVLPLQGCVCCHNITEHSPYLEVEGYELPPRRILIWSCGHRHERIKENQTKPMKNEHTWVALVPFPDFPTTFWLLSRQSQVGCPFCISNFLFRVSGRQKKRCFLLLKNIFTGCQILVSFWFSMHFQGVRFMYDSYFVIHYTVFGIFDDIGLR